MPGPSSNANRILLCALILGAFALRVYKLESQSLWYDEGVSAIVAQYDLSSLAQWTADDIQPPLYYALLAGWGRLAGWSEWSLRFPSVAFGLLIGPLLAALAIRWSRSRLAGLLAALFAALHPLLLYYSQEARMYTLLVALGTGVAYCVLRIAYGGREAKGEGTGRLSLWILWALYGLLATAALYTHYFAAFLLLAVNLAYLLHLPPNPPAAPQTPLPTQSAIRNFLPWLLANAVVLLLFFPWLGTLFTRLDVDTSYWEGSLKLREAMTAIAIRFTSGETVLEGNAIRLLWMYGAVTLLAAWGQVASGRGQGAGGRWQVASGRAQVEGGRGQGAGDQTSRFTFHTLHALLTTHYPLSTIQYPLFILLLPIAAVLTLASFTPKFNARYVMVALPGLLLLWSGGLAALLRGFLPLWQRLQRVACNTEPRALPALAGLVGTGLLLAGFVQADANWFTDNAFTKDQWRSVAGYLRGHMDEKNPVVLVSGHAWPIWRYYVPEIEPVRLPAIEILDVNAVVDLDNSTDILRPALADAEGVWLVNWQAEVIDPGDVAGLQLERAGQEEPISAQFWGLRLRRFVNVDARAISNAPPIQQPMQANFGDSVELLGHSVEENGDLLLFWRLTQATQPLPDLYLTGETRTPAGLLYSRLGDRRLAAYDFPTFRWQIGQVVVGRIPANEWIGGGALPGNYHLRLGVYDPAGDPAGLDLIGPGGERLGKRATVEIGLARPVPLPPEEKPTTRHPLVDGLFVRPILVSSRAEAGEPLTLQILWYSPSDRPVGEVVAHWKEEKRAAPREGARLPVEIDLPAGQAVRTAHQISVPLNLPPGDYWLELTGENVPTRPVELPVTILPSSRTFALPPLTLNLLAEFGGQVTLAGLAETEMPAVIPPGEVVSLTLVWQAGASISADYTVSAQWLDGNGLPAGQIDLPLPRGSSHWLPNEVISQIIKLVAPTQPGEYRLIVAVYNASGSGLPRLRLPGGEDFVQIAQLPVHR